MTSYVPPIKNGAGGWIGYVSLAPRTATGTWQSNPTLASGDVKISIDGGSLANLTTLPAVTPASSKLVKITLSQAETNGDNLTIIFSDAAGAEWCDLTINLQTVARQIDDLAYPATSGRSITVDASGNANANLVNIAGSAVSTTTAQLGVNVVQISTDATAADNLEAQFDGTGLSGDTFPATQAQIASIAAAAGGSFVATVADSNAGGTNPLNGVTFVGSVSSGSYTNLAAEGGTGLTLAHSTNVIDAVFQYSVPRNSIPLGIEFDGYLNSSNDTCPIYVYDFVGAAWVQVATLNGQNGTTNTGLSIALGEAKYQSSGVAYVRFHSVITNTQTLFLDKLVMTYANQTVGYDLGSIWVDSTLSNTNTTSFVDGVADNPVSTLAAAATLSANINLRSFVFASGSSFTLAAAFASKTVNGEGFTIALGGQNIGGSVFRRFASISGTGTGSFPYFESGSIGAVTLPACAVVDCGFSSTFTAGGTGNYSFTQCRAAAAGASVPSFDFSGQGGAVNVFFRYWSGGMGITLDSNCTVSLDVISGATVTVNGTGGSIAINGICTIVDNSGGAVTITQTNVINMTKINAEADTAISDAFNFTVAGQVDANIQYVNDVQVTGTGASGDEWGP